MKVLLLISVRFQEMAFGTVYKAGSGWNPLCGPYQRVSSRNTLWFNFNLCICTHPSGRIFTQRICFSTIATIFFQSAWLVFFRGSHVFERKIQLLAIEKYNESQCTAFSLGQRRSWRSYWGPEALLLSRLIAEWTSDFGIVPIKYLQSTRKKWTGNLKNIMSSIV